jgi:peptidoglycan/LPS O-acetylase OafA/YrhL
LPLVGIATIVAPLSQQATIFSTVSYFLCGVLIARSPPFPLRALSSLLLSMLFGLVILTLLFSAYRLVAHQSAVTAAKTLWRDPLCLLSAGAILVAALYLPVAMTALGSRPMVNFGRISYSIYLLHMAVINIVLWAIGHRAPALAGVLIILITVAAASASNRWIEVPARQFLIARLALHKRPARLRASAPLEFGAHLRKAHEMVASR